MISEQTSTMYNNYITGVMVQYYKACHRELWYFSKKIDFNEEDENIRLGKLIHQNTFKRELSEISLGFVKFDFVEIKDKIIISEIKKSDKLLEPAKYQLLYYIYITEQLVEKKVIGKLRIPKKREIITIELTDELRAEIKKILVEINRIIGSKNPPKPSKKNYCTKCAYYYFCWV